MGVELSTKLASKSHLLFNLPHFVISRVASRPGTNWI